jgi:large subunit ribosomal protein L18
MIKKSKKTSRLRIKKSVRTKISGTETRPRLSVFRSLNNIYAQLIDDVNHRTLLQVSTLSPELNESLKNATRMQKSEKVGEELGRRAIEKNITNVVFDRNGYRYHGRVKTLADAARKAGLKF